MKVRRSRCGRSCPSSSITNGRPAATGSRGKCRTMPSGFTSDPSGASPRRTASIVSRRAGALARSAFRTPVHSIGSVPVQSASADRRGTVPSPGPSRSSARPSPPGLAGSTSVSGVGKSTLPRQCTSYGRVPDRPFRSQASRNSSWNARICWTASPGSPGTGRWVIVRSRAPPSTRTARKFGSSSATASQVQRPCAQRLVEPGGHVPVGARVAGDRLAYQHPGGLDQPLLRGAEGDQGPCRVPAALALEVVPPGQAARPVADEDDPRVVRPVRVVGVRLRPPAVEFAGHPLLQLPGHEPVGEPPVVPERHELRVGRVPESGPEVRIPQAGQQPGHGVRNLKQPFGVQAVRGVGQRVPSPGGRDASVSAVAAESISRSLHRAQTSWPSRYSRVPRNPGTKTTRSCSTHSPLSLRRGTCAAAGSDRTGPPLAGP